MRIRLNGEVGHTKRRRAVKYGRPDGEEEQRMRQLRPWLWIGTRHDVRNQTLLWGHRITAMLELATGVQVPGIVCHILPIEDTEPIHPLVVREGVEFVLKQHEAGGTVLITCGGGFSRSVSFAVAVLHETEGMSLSEALEDVRAQHPEADPHPVLWQSIRDYYEGGWPSGK